MKERKQGKSQRLAYAKTHSNVVDILRTKRMREELPKLFNTSDSRAREMISECALYFPVITYSSKEAGYVMAPELENLSMKEILNVLEEIGKAKSDYLGRIERLKDRLYPLIEYEKEARKILEQNGVVEDGKL